MTARVLIAAGYRLHWVEVTYRVPVLCKPEKPIADYDAKQFTEDDCGDPEVATTPMRVVGLDIRECIPHTTADLDGDPPTIGELWAAQQEINSAPLGAERKKQ